MKCDNCMQNGVCLMKARFLKMHPLGKIAYCFDFIEKDSEPKPMTNGDRIRAMSDEELANIICCPIIGSDDICDKQYDCIACSLEWLKQSAEAENV